MTETARDRSVTALQDFGCDELICDVIRELPRTSTTVVQGSAREYRLVLPAPGTTSAMHAHRDRLYFLMKPDRGLHLHEQHGASLMRHNRTTWYASWPATALADPQLRAVAVEAAVEALDRAAERARTPDDGKTGRRARIEETCSICWVTIGPSGNCNCY